MSKFTLRGQLLLVPIILAGMLGPAWAQQPPPVALRVTVISVVEFDDPDWDNPALRVGFRKAAAEVDAFFQSAFGVKPTILSSRDATTSDQLRTMLATVGASPRGTLHVVFVLSHGEVVKQASEMFSRELYVMTSDAPKASYQGRAITAQAIIDSFRKSPQPTAALVFLDTCHSGGAINLGLELATNLDRLFGVRTMVLAATTADDAAYKGLFTRAIISLWKRSGACTLGEYNVENLVSQEIAELANVEGVAIQQRVRLLIPYQGQLCLESLGEHTALALLYNPTTQPVIVKVLERATRVIFDRELRGRDIAPIRLNRSRYEILADFQDGKPTEIAVDLTKDAVQFVALSDAISAPRDVAKAAEQGAEYVLASGVSPVMAAYLFRAAGATYRAVGDANGARRATDNVAKTGTDVLSVGLSPAGLWGDGAESVAEKAVLKGQFDFAGRLFLNAAKAASESDPNDARRLESRAYLALLAAGLPADALRVKELAESVTTKSCDECATVKTVEAALAVRQKATVALLSPINVVAHERSDLHEVAGPLRFRSDLYAANRALDRVSSMLEETQERVRQNEARIAQVDAKATHAMTQAAAAETAAAAAHQTVARVAQRYSDAVPHGLTAELLDEVTLSEQLCVLGTVGGPDRKAIDMAVESLRDSGGYIEIVGHNCRAQATQAVYRYFRDVHAISLHLMHTIELPGGDQKAINLRFVR